MMRKNANAKVFCTMKDERLSFYLLVGMKQIYLFDTYHSWPIFREYENGRPIDYLFRNSRQFRQQKIRSRILQWIVYVEKEYNLELLQKTKVKTKQQNKRSRARAAEEHYRHTV